MPKGKSLEVTQEHEDWIKENISYDSETGHLWWLKQNIGSGARREIGQPAGSKSLGYLIVNIYLEDSATTLKCHRLAWFLHYGIWPKKHLDHINGIKDDNRIVNLREANASENAANRSKPMMRGGKLVTSKYKGVDWDKCAGKWRSRVVKNYKSIYLGHYDSEEEAALAYNKTALELFGEYAKINDVTP